MEETKSGPGPEAAARAPGPDPNEPPDDSPEVAGTVPPARPRRRPGALLLGGVFALALALRALVLWPGGPATPAERAILDAAETDAATRPPGLSDATVSLAAFLSPRIPPPAVPPGVVEGMAPTPDGTLLVLRWLGALAGAVGAVLLAIAGRRLAGPRIGGVAGALLAVSPLALDLSTSVGPGALLLLAAPGALLALVSWVDSGRLAGALAAGAWSGLAAAGGGGGAALLVGAPWAARRTAVGVGRGVALAAVAGVVVLALAAPGFVRGFPALPEGVGVFPVEDRSPLGAALLRLAQGSGWVIALLLPLGVRRLLARDDAAGAAILASTIGVLLLALLRGDAAPAWLASALPGVLLIGSCALAAPRQGPSRPPLARLLGVAAFVLPVVGTAGLLATRWATTPAEQAAEWVRRHLPNGATFLCEDPGVHVATPVGLGVLSTLVDEGVVSRTALADYAVGDKTFRPIALPPADAGPSEAVLFYDPNLAVFFPWMILRDGPPSDPARPEVESVRGIFHEYFRTAWKEVAAFPPGASRQSGLVVLERPEGFELDRARLAPLKPLLAGPGISETRERSTAFTAWLREAGAALLADGELTGARGFLELATTRDVTNAEGFYQLALLDLLRGRNDQAKPTLLKGLDLDPYHGGLHYNLGLVLEAEGDTVGAETEYRAAAMQLADPSAAHARLGALLHAQGDLAGAREELRRVRETAPGLEADRWLSEILGAP